MNDTFFAKKKEATVRLVLRLCVSVYLLYLAHQLIKALTGGTGGAPVWVCWIFIILFAFVAVLLAIYSIRQYGQAINDAKKAADEYERKQEDLPEGEKHDEDIQGK